MHQEPTASQFDLLFQAGIWGLCRVPPGSLSDVTDLRRAGLVDVGEDGCFRLTLIGQRTVVLHGGVVHRH